MAQTFSYCFECEELCYGIPSNNGVYTKDSAATNHWDHLCHNFRDPENYTPPVKMLLIKLGAGVEISDLEMQIAKIGIHLDDAVTPNFGGKWTQAQLEEWREKWVQRGRGSRVKQIKVTAEKPHPRFPNSQTALIWVPEDTAETPHENPRPVQPPPAQCAQVATPEIQLALF